MGYRSNVTYIVTFACAEPEKAYAQFIKFYRWVTEQHKVEYKGSDEVEAYWYDYKRARAWCEDVPDKFYWNVDEMTLVFETCNIKWYPSFVDIRWHEQLLEKVRYYSCGAFKYIRVGEDSSDIECKEWGGDDIPINFYLDLYTETRIVCDLPDEKNFTEETP